MHELPATQGILTVALDAARGVGAERITAIDLVIGELTSIVDDSVQFYFDVLSRSTAAEGAALRVQRVPATAACSGCGDRWGVVPPLSPMCDRCGSLAITVTGGREFFIASIEVDE